MRQRKLDCEILWPDLLGGSEGDLRWAQNAMLLHAMTDAAWRDELTEMEIYRVIAGLTANEMALEPHRGLRAVIESLLETKNRQWASLWAPGGLFSTRAKFWCASQASAGAAQRGGPGGQLAALSARSRLAPEVEELGG